jgi:hypothetical protein
VGQQTTNGYLLIFCEIVFRDFPRDQPLIHIAIKIEFALLDQPHHHHCSERLANRGCLKQRFRRDRLLPARFQHTIAARPLDLSVIN